jgi:hypothetical protein
MTIAKPTSLDRSGQLPRSLFSGLGYITTFGNDALGRYRPMDEQEWAKRLKAGIGGRNLWRLRWKVAVATALDLIAVGRKMARADANGNTLDSVDAMGFLLQMTGKLMFASANLLSKRQYYAGAALLRQVTEIEYLTWSIKENHRTIEHWLRSTHKEQMSSFAPVQLRRTARGRFFG